MSTHLKEFGHDNVLDLLEEPLGLKSLTGDVQGEVVGVNDNFDPANPLGQLVFSEIAGDKYAFDE